MAQADREARAAPAPRLDAELLSQPLERRVERVERGRGRGKAAVLVARPVPLLDPREVEERLGEIVALADARPRSTCSQAASRVRHVVAEAEVVGAERVEHPAGAPFDARRDQRNAALTTRASCVAPGLGIVEREDRLDVRRSLEGGALARQQRDRPAPVLALGRHRCGAPAEQVEVRDAREVDSERGGQPVPEPEARVHLHELEAAVARIALELHLRDAVEVEGPEQAQGRVHRLLHPDGLADAARADAGRRLAELAAAEEAEDGAVGGDVAADGVQLVVAARDELLHHRLERLRVGVRALELFGRLAAEGLAAKAAPEAVGVRRLDEQRVADARSPRRAPPLRIADGRSRGCRRSTAAARSSCSRLLWTRASVSRSGKG